jgi:hypothetical protein
MYICRNVNVNIFSNVMYNNIYVNNENNNVYNENMKMKKSVCNIMTMKRK